MNYMKEILAFYDWAETNEVSPAGILIWHALMHQSNKARWPERIAVPISILEERTRLKRSTIYKARNKLQQSGRIRFQARDGNQSAEYEIIPFYVHETDTAVDTVGDRTPDNLICVHHVDTVVDRVVDTVVDATVDTVGDHIKTNTKTKTKTRQTEDLLRDPPQAEAPRPLPAVITLALNDKSEYPVTEEQISQWRELYPAVDIMQALRNMSGWIEGNPTKRKTRSGILRFINAWLKNEQNKGGGTVASQANASRVYGHKNDFIQG